MIRVPSELFSWFFIGWYHALIQSIHASWNWLFPEVYKLPALAPVVRELVRGHLSQKSWFDRIACAWVELSFGNQVLSVAAVVLVGGLIGLMAYAPLLCALDALSVCMLTHVLFVADEFKKRSTLLIARNHTMDQYSLNLEQQKVEIERLTRALAKSTETLIANQEQGPQQ